uniref:CYRIA/CYRIB Rac1 binding domain-containing protein n=1 Tax=Panagrolaimus superbus TaxID=310955 RepID=A0A914Y667_9BILA
MPTISTGCTDTILALLRTNNTNYDLYKSIDVFLDVEHINPTADEKQACEMVTNFLIRSEEVIKYLQDYKNGALNEMKHAFENPDKPEIQQQAFELLQHSFDQTKKCLEVAAHLKQIVPCILWSMVKGPLPLVEQLNVCQALCCQFSLIIDFVHRFDELKMNTPNVINDISFYRRMMNRADSVAQCSQSYNIEEGNEVLFFFSEPTPMLKALVDSTKTFVANAELKIENTVDTLTCFVSVCRQMLERKSNVEKLSANSQNFFTRVLVGAFILLDHTDPNGAFCRQSPIDVKSLVTVIKMNSTESEGLLSAMKFTSKNFNNPKTPKAIKALFN